MGMPTKPLLDIMRRSMANLEFVGEHATASGPFEVTQLINTFLGAFAHPFEAMRNDLMAQPLADAAGLGWPQIEKELPSDLEPSSLGALIRLIRNALAHGNVEFIPDGKDQIRSVRVWNIRLRTKKRTWGAVISVQDMRCFLDRFVQLIEERHKECGWYDQAGAS